MAAVSGGNPAAAPVVGTKAEGGGKGKGNDKSGKGQGGGGDTKAKSGTKPEADYCKKYLAHNCDLGKSCKYNHDYEHRKKLDEKKDGKKGKKNESTNGRKEEGPNERTTKRKYHQTERKQYNIPAHPRNATDPKQWQDTTRRRSNEPYCTKAEYRTEAEQ